MRLTRMLNITTTIAGLARSSALCSTCAWSQPTTLKAPFGQFASMTLTSTYTTIDATSPSRAAS